VVSPRWSFTIFFYEGAYLMAVADLPTPYSSSDPYDDEPTWPTRDAAMAALTKWANGRGLTVEVDKLTEHSVIGQLVKVMPT
jgi:hypothetical protein